MIKYFCDKCGKELNVNTFTNADVFTVSIEPPELRKWTDDAETGIHILCFDCTKKLNKWFHDQEH